MAQKIKKQFFRILPASVALMLVFGLVIGIYTNLPTNIAEAAQAQTTAIELLDNNGNGKIDRILISIDNPDNDTWTAGAAGSSVTQSGAGITISSVTLATAGNANPVMVNIDLSEADPDLLVNTDGVNSGAIEYIYVPQGIGNGGIEDGVGGEEMNAIASGDNNSTDIEIDAASPVALAYVFKDIQPTNGTVDRIDITYSEAMQVAYEGGDWSHPETGTINIWNHTGAIASGSDVQLTVLANPNTGSPTLPTLTYDAAAGTANSVKDLATVPNPAASFTAQTVTDGAAPYALSSQAFYEDNDNDGIIDRIKLLMTTDESLACDYEDSDWSFPNPGTVNLADPTDCSVVGSNIFITVGSAAANKTGGLTNPTVSYVNAGPGGVIHDLAGNATASFGPITLTDNAAPILFGASYLDINGNGSVDRIRTVWSENVIMSSSTTDDWVIGAGDINAVYAATPDDTDGDSNVDIYITADANKTGSATPVTIQYKVANGIIADEGPGGFGSFADSATITATDAAAPVQISRVFKDIDENGTLDRIDVTYTETVQLTDVDSTDWTIPYGGSAGGAIYTGIPPIAVDGVTVSGTVVQISKAGVVNRTGMVDSPTLAYNSANGIANSLKDTAAIPNPAISFGPLSIDDGAPPIPLSAKYEDSDADGTVDRIAVLMSYDRILSCTYEALDWTIDIPGTINLSSISGCSVSSNTIYLPVSANALTGGAVDPSFHYTNQGISGSVKDLALNATPSSVSITITDETAPQISYFGYGDAGPQDGKIDYIEVGFTEDVTAASFLSANDLVFNDVGSFTGAVFGTDTTDMLTGLSTSTSIYLETAATARATYDVSGNLDIFTRNAFSLVDASGNTNTTLGSQLGATYEDFADPYVYLIETDDADFNGKIDSLNLSVSENLNDSADPYSGITVSLGGGYTYSVINTGASAGDDKFRISLIENAGACNKDDLSGCDTSATPAVNIDTNTELQDFSTNKIQSGALVATTDKAQPVAIARVTADSDHNGHINIIAFFLSEDLSVSDPPLTATVSGHITGAWGALAPNLIYVGISEAVAYDTDATPAVQITASGGMADSAGNLIHVDTSEVTPFDLAEPAIISAVYKDDDIDGYVEKITLNFSETIDASASNFASENLILNGDLRINGATFGSGTTQLFSVDASTLDITLATTTADYQTSDSGGPTISLIGTGGGAMNEFALLDLAQETSAFGAVGNGSSGYSWNQGNVNLSDGAAPYLYRFITSAGDGYYNEGDALDILATYSEPIVGGSIQVDMNSGRNDFVLSDIATSSFNKSYIVAAGENTLDWGVINIDSNSATDGINVASSTLLPPENIYTNSDIVLDTIKPTPSIAASDNPTYEGDLVQTVVVTYDETMDNTTNPVITGGSSHWTQGAGVWSTVINSDDTYTVDMTHDGTQETITAEVFTIAPGSGATDLAGNAENGAVSGSFLLDTQKPTATLTPTAAAGPGINAAEYAAGVDVVVGLGTSGAVAGDSLELLINGTGFANILQFHVLTAPDILAGTYTFTVPNNADLAAWADATMPVLTTVVSDVAGNEGVISAPLNLTIDTTVPTIASVTSDANPAGPLKIGETIVFTVTPTIAEAGLTIAPTTYNGGALAWATTNGGTTYTATYTILAGQTDQPTPLQLLGVTATDAVGNTGAVVDGADVVMWIDAHTPTVLTFNPANLATGVALTAPVVITFSEPMNTATFAYTLSGATGVVWTIGNTVATISHTAFTNSTPYTLTLNTAADVAGNALTGSTTTSFTTVAPVIGGGGGGGGAASNSVSSYNSSLTVSSSQTGSLTQTFSDGSIVNLNIPVGGVSASTTFSVTQGSLTSNNTPVSTSGAIIIGNQTYNFTAVSNNTAITSFPANLTVTITIPTLPDVISDLGVYYFDSASNKWLLIPGAVFDTANNKVTFTVNHLTQFAVIKIAGVPATIAASGVPVPEVVPVVPPTTSTLAIQDPANLTTLLANLNLVRNQADEDKYRPLIQADAKEFGITLSSAQLSAIVNFVVYGISPATIKLGSGERRAVIRDYFETVVRPDIVWTDIELITTGHKPIKRNLAKEQAIVGRVLTTFRTLTGHSPNFKDAKDDLAWNTMMYRIRFSRDLVRERVGILKFIEKFGRSPWSPLGWATVRAWGYIYYQ